MPGKTDESFKNGSVHKSNTGAVGPQGKGGAIGSGSSPLVNNPRGIEPKVIGGGKMPLSQGPIQPKVGK